MIALVLQENAIACCIFQNLLLKRLFAFRKVWLVRIIQVSKNRVVYAEFNANLFEFLFLPVFSDIMLLKIVQKP